MPDPGSRRTGHNTPTGGSRTVALVVGASSSSEELACRRPSSPTSAVYRGAAMCAPLLLLLHLPIHSAKATHGPRPPPADPPSPLVVTQPQVPQLDPCTCRATRPRARLHRLLRRQPGQRPRLRRGRRPGRPRLCSRRRHPRLVRALPSLCACIDTLLTLLAPRTHAAAEGRQASWARSRLARSTMAERCTASFPPRCVPFALITYTLSPARPGKSPAAAL